MELIPFCSKTTVDKEYCLSNHLQIDSALRTVFRLTEKMSFLSRFIKLTCTFVVKLAALIGAILLVLVLPCIVLLLSPIYIFRIFISKISKWVRPDLGKIITTRATLTAVYDVYSNPSMTVVITSVIDGNAELETLKREFIGLTKKRNKNGDLLYPELLQYLHNWMGFIFWKWDEEFDISNHARLEVHENFDKSKADEMRSQLVTKPFQRNRSPWEVILVNDYKDSDISEDSKPKSMLFVRFHHAIGDGFSMMKMIFNLTQSYKELEKLRASQRPLRNKSIETVVQEIFAVLKSPYDLLYTILKTVTLRPWGISQSESSNEFICATSRTIPMGFVKEIKRGYNVGFTSVLLAALTAGTRKVFEKKRLIQKVPENMYCATVLPMKGHPDKLRNYMTFGLIPFPVGEPDSKQSLLKCCQNYKEVLRSSSPLAIFLVLPLVGGLFHWMVKPISYVMLGGVCLSNFPGPRERLTIGGQDWLNISFTYGPCPGTQGVAFSVFTYVDGISISVLVNKNIIDKASDVKALVDGIADEFDILIRDLV